MKENGTRCGFPSCKSMPGLTLETSITVNSRFLLHCENVALGKGSFSCRFIFRPIFLTKLSTSLQRNDEIVSFSLLSGAYHVVMLLKLFHACFFIFIMIN